MLVFEAEIVGSEAFNLCAELPKSPANGQLTMDN